MGKKRTIKKIFEYEKADDIFICQSELDYHDLGPLTPYDIEEILVRFLEDCYLSKNTQVRVITGKGQVVRPLVQKLLRQNKFVEKYKSGGYFTGQDGAFEVTLKTRILN